MNFLRFSASLLMLTACAGIIISTEALWRLAEQTRKTEVAYVGLAGSLPNKIDTISNNINKQFSQLNGTISLSSGYLLVQTGSLERDLSKTLAGIDDLTATLRSSDLGLTADMHDTLFDLQTVVKNPDIPASVRDLRQTLALTGSTMAHVRGLANTMAEAAPQMAASANLIAASSAGITADVHKLTTDMTKPKKWYQQAVSYIVDGVKIGGVIF